MFTNENIINRNVQIIANVSILLDKNLYKTRRHGAGRASPLDVAVWTSAVRRSETGPFMTIAVRIRFLQENNLRVFVSTVVFLLVVRLKFVNGRHDGKGHALIN